MIRKIHQVVTNFSRQDAVGTDVYLMKKALQELGYESEIFFEESGDGQIALPISRLQPSFDDPETAILFHFCIGSSFAGRFVGIQNKKIVRYHNVTPPHFFQGVEDEVIRRACSLGRQQIKMLAEFSDFLIADSEYNAAEFHRYRAIPTAVLPVFRDYEQLVALPDAGEVAKIMKNCGKPTMLYVGRICPNKAQDDLIALVARYKYTFEEPLGLILIGGFFSVSYRKKIEEFARHLDLKLGFSLDDLPSSDVCILGKVDDQKLATLYRTAQVFCSMSEHEGFGVPLVEARRFDLPVLAHRAAAVPETLGPEGVLFEKANDVDLLCKLRNILKKSKPSSTKDSRVAFENKYSLPSLKTRLANTLRECL